ncbi:hypothetical protein BLNAU_11826 [Blattamonas nauphoetae]|uniref:Right handed beta helix domain-containing protein n=1 Tax=Blattamonas nauphoetae TaxID=2049346 RepID=A0ABQ9XRU1_9EUKA|nr:hypothetical protein BLNAU_11826 [Blattamonas nauphoetae]
MKHPLFEVHNSTIALFSLHLEQLQAANIAHAGLNSNIVISDCVIDHDGSIFNLVTSNGGQVSIKSTQFHASSKFGTILDTLVFAPDSPVELTFSDLQIMHGKHTMTHPILSSPLATLTTINSCIFRNITDISPGAITPSISTQAVISGLNVADCENAVDGLISINSNSHTSHLLNSTFQRTVRNAKISCIGDDLMICSHQYVDTRSVFRDAGTYSLTFVIFEGCLSYKDWGGSLYVEQDTHISDCMFKDSHSDMYFGGAIMHGGASLYINRTIFWICDAYNGDADGGAIRFDDVYAELGTTEVTDSYFLSNVGLSGGAINGRAAQCKIINCIFDDSIAYSFGGCICLWQTDTTYLEIKYNAFLRTLFQKIGTDIHFYDLDPAFDFEGKVIGLVTTSPIIDGGNCSFGIDRQQYQKTENTSIIRQVSLTPSSIRTVSADVDAASSFDGSTARSVQAAILSVANLAWVRMSCLSCPVGQPKRGGQFG